MQAEGGNITKSPRALVSHGGGLEEPHLIASGVRGRQYKSMEVMTVQTTLTTIRNNDKEIYKRNWSLYKHAP